MSNDITKSQEASLKRLIEEFKNVSEDIVIHQNFKRTLTKQIIDFLELLDLKKFEGVKMVDKFNIGKVSLKQLKNMFNIDTNDTETKSLLDSVVVTVDLEGTYDNFIYVNGMAEVMAEKIIEKLKSLQESKYLDLEILK